MGALWQTHGSHDAQVSCSCAMGSDDCQCEYNATSLNETAVASLNETAKLLSSWWAGEGGHVGAYGRGRVVVRGRGVRNGNRYRGRVVVRGGGYGHRGGYRGGYRGYGYRGYGHRGFVPCLYATPMVVAVAAMLGATAAVSVSADELGDQAFAAWFGAFVQYSAPLQFTNPAGPMHAFTLPAVCESTCAPLLCKWLRVDFYQVVLHPN